MKTFTLSYFTRCGKGSKKEQLKLFARLICAGKRNDFSLNRKLDPRNWDTTKSKLKGRSPEVKELEKFLATIEETFYKLERDLINKSIPVNGENMIQAYLELITGNSKNKKTLMQAGIGRKKLKDRESKSYFYYYNNLLLVSLDKSCAKKHQF